MITAERTRDTDLARYLRVRTLDAGHEAMTAILAQAALGGEVDPDRLTPRIVALPVTLLLYEAVAGGRPPSQVAHTEIVDDFLLPLVVT